MDESVKAAMAKWPNVPHCYGWLALDARGQWRLRDERAQALGLPGDRLAHPTLLGFINRNYLADELGRWYFQNGPQRVYVDLDVAPYIAHTDPQAGFVLHTGQAFDGELKAWLTADGRFLLEGGGRLAALDDRDAADCLARLELDGKPVDDAALLAWLEGAGVLHGALTLAHAGGRIPVERLDTAGLAHRFGFVATPRA